MSLFLHKQGRQSIRLPGYDYSQAGAYFVTVCTKGRVPLFGKVDKGQINLGVCGPIVQAAWDALPGHYPFVSLDAFVVMPNHGHGVIVLTDAVGARSPRPHDPTSSASTASLMDRAGGETPPLHAPTLGQVVAFFKYQSTKAINQVRSNPGLPLWQRNYYEHVVRSEASLNRIRQYILDNPVNWSTDIENPQHAWCAGLPASLNDEVAALIK